MSEGVPTTKLFGLRLLVCQIRNYNLWNQSKVSVLYFAFDKKMDQWSFDMIKLCGLTRQQKVKLNKVPPCFHQHNPTW
jgi:hypothetical protein